MDLHQKEVQGFFHVPVDNLRASTFLVAYIQDSVSLSNKVVCFQFLLLLTFVFTSGSGCLYFCPLILKWSAFVFVLFLLSVENDDFLACFSL